MAGHVLYKVKTPDGKIHASAAHAAKALGVARGTVYYHLHTYGHLENVGGRHKPERAKALNERNSRRLTFGKLEFASMAACSRWLGKEESYVKIVLRDNPGKKGMEKIGTLVLRRAMHLEGKKLAMAEKLFNRGDHYE